jgi:hypothetical protein
MTRDEIARMAREAGMERIVAVGVDGTQTVEVARIDLLERFAALVAAAEREACARVCDWWNVSHCASCIRARGVGDENTFEVIE